MISGTPILPARPFTPAELNDFLLSRSDCERIFVFSDPKVGAVCEERGFRKVVTREIVSIDLAKSREALWSEMDQKRRNGLRFAQKSGVVIQQATSDLASAYHRVFVEGYCKKYNVPTGDADQRVAAWIAAKSLFVARLGEDGPVMAGITLRDATEAKREGERYFESGVYAVYSTNSSLLEYQKYRPNEALIWDAVLRLKERGYHEFVLGSAGALFKRKFSDRRLFVDEWSRP